MKLLLILHENPLIIFSRTICLQPEYNQTTSFDDVEHSNTFIIYERHVAVYVVDCTL